MAIGKSFAASVTLVITVSALVILGVSQQAQAQNRGWLNKLSGGTLTTPEPIQNLNPFQPRPEPTSSLQAVSEPYIASDGRVFGRGSNTTHQRVIGRASQKKIHGRIFWVYGSLRPVPVPPQFQKLASGGGNGLGQAEPGVPIQGGSIQFGGEQRRSLYSIRRDGSVYHRGTRVGMAKRTRFPSGRTGWVKLVNTQQLVVKYDNSPSSFLTSLRSIKNL